MIQESEMFEEGRLLVTRKAFVDCKNKPYYRYEINVCNEVNVLVNLSTNQKRQEYVHKVIRRSMKVEYI